MCCAVECAVQANAVTTDQCSAVSEKHYMTVHLDSLHLTLGVVKGSGWLGPGFGWDLQGQTVSDASNWKLMHRERCPSLFLRCHTHVERP